MKKMNLQTMVLVAILPMLMLLSAQAQACLTWFIIDDFNSESFHFVQDFIPSNGGELGDATPVDGTNIVMTKFPTVGPTIPSDWTRLVSADLISGDSVETQVCSNCQAGHLASGAADSVGNSDFTYLGITPLDLPGDPISNKRWITFDYAADQDGAIVEFTFTDAGGVSETFSSDPLLNTNFSSDITDPTNRTFVRIDWPGGLLDYRQITGIRIDILGVPDLDFSIDNAMIHHIPEPATIALMGLGLAGLGWKRHRGIV